MLLPPLEPNKITTTRIPLASDESHPWNIPVASFHFHPQNPETYPSKQCLAPYIMLPATGSRPAYPPDGSDALQMSEAYC